MPLFSRIENAIVSYVIYIKQMFYPVGLETALLQSARRISSMGSYCRPRIVGGISLAAFLCRKRFPYLIVGWLWYLVMMLPVIGLVQISYYVRADRYTYLSHIGLYLLVVWGTVDLTRALAWLRELLTFAGLLLIGLLVMQARVQASYWHDSEKLWRYVLVWRPITLLPVLIWDLFLMRKGRVGCCNRAV